MTVTIDPTSTTAPPTAAPATAGATTPTSRPRQVWAAWGAVAGVAAIAATFLGMPANLTEEQYRMGVDVIDDLSRGGFHAGFLLSLVSIASLLVASAGWRRWAERRAPDDLAARTIPTALAATATVNVIGAAMMGSLALYLPGGMDEGWLSREGMFANFNYLDFGILFGWWGTLVAAVCVATLALRRSNVLPRWMGVASILLVIPPVAFATLTALPGFPGLTMPIWLAVVSIGMVVSTKARA